MFLPGVPIGTSDVTFEYSAVPLMEAVMLIASGSLIKSEYGAPHAVWYETTLPRGTVIPVRYVDVSSNEFANAALVPAKVVTVLGDAQRLSCKVVRPVTPVNAALPMLVTLVGISKEPVKPVDAKAPSPINSTLFPMVRLPVKPESKNAP